MDVAYCYTFCGVVCVSLCDTGVPCKNGWTTRDAVWHVGPDNHVLNGGSRSPQGKGSLGVDIHGHARGRYIQQDDAVFYRSSSTFCYTGRILEESVKHLSGVCTIKHTRWFTRGSANATSVCICTSAQLPIYLLMFVFWYSIFRSVAECLVLLLHSAWGKAQQNVLWRRPSVCVCPSLHSCTTAWTPMWLWEMVGGAPYLCTI